jgi:hypothetical protein
VSLSEGDDDEVTSDGVANEDFASFGDGVVRIGVYSGERISESSERFLEGNPMSVQIDRGLPRVPLERDPAHDRST